MVKRVKRDKALRVTTFYLHCLAMQILLIPACISHANTVFVFTYVSKNVINRLPQAIMEYPNLQRKLQLF